MLEAVKSDPNVMHGTMCFRGTRVAVQTLFDWLEEGHSVDFFLEQFPTVTREQAVAVLEKAKQLTLEQPASHA